MKILVLHCKIPTEGFRLRTSRGRKKLHDASPDIAYICADWLVLLHCRGICGDDSPDGFHRHGDCFHVE